MITAIIQARMNSTRLPGKAMRLLAGKPMLQHVVERVKQCVYVTQVIIATTPFPDDQQIVDWCAQHKIMCIAWNRLLSDGKNDVLGRYVEASHHAFNYTLMRVTGDCPVWRPDLGEQVIDAYLSSSIKYAIASNVHPDLDGFDTEVFSRDALALTNLLATDVYDRQHVTPWMYRELNKIRVDHLKEVGGQKLSVDTEDDFVRVEQRLQSNMEEKS